MVVDIVRNTVMLVVATGFVAGCQPGELNLQPGGSTPQPDAAELQETEQVGSLAFGADQNIFGIELSELTAPGLAEFGPLYVPTQYITLQATALSGPLVTSLWRDQDGDGVREWTVRHELSFAVSFQDSLGDEQFWIGLVACRAGNCRYLSENLQEYVGVHINYEDTVQRNEPSQVAALERRGFERFLPNSWHTNDNLVCLQVNFLLSTGQLDNYTNCGVGIVHNGIPYLILTRRPGGTVASEARVMEAIETAVTERLAPSGSS